MKKIFFLIIWILIFQTQSSADDIRNFKIEGMSIGDSALKYFSKDQIIANKYFAYPLKTYFQTHIRTPNSKMYNAVQLSIKDGDNNFIIEMDTGLNSSSQHGRQQTRKMPDPYTTEQHASRGPLGIPRMAYTTNNKKTRNAKPPQHPRMCQIGTQRDP